MCNFKAKCRLFDSLVSSGVLYASQFWAINNFDEVDRVQNFFLRRAMGVSKYVPGYILRLEGGRPPLKFYIIKITIFYCKKLIFMEESRYAKQCFRALLLQAD